MNKISGAGKKVSKPLPAGQTKLNREQTAEAAETFLNAYMKTNDFFTPERELAKGKGSARSARVGFYRAIPDTEKPNLIYYFFTFGDHYRSSADPELQAIVKEAMAQLKKVHPEVKNFKEKISIRAQS